MTRFRYYLSLPFYLLSAFFFFLARMAESVGDFIGGVY